MRHSNESIGSIETPAPSSYLSPAALASEVHAAEPTDVPLCDHQLGILFVHGIGEQPEGETLLGFGEPVINWLNRWLGRHSDPKQRGSVEVVTSVLTPSKLPAQVPPHAEVRVRLPEKGGEQSWLMAESWWGGDVQRPPFGRVAGWMMTIGAWTILAHVTKHIGRHSSAPARWALYLIALVEWIVLASLLQLTIIVLSVFTILPIPGIRNALSGVLLAVTGVLGDSYVLIESDLQRSAIVNKTHEALAWLGARCDSVVVIAHSQGAAIAHLALRNPEPRNVRTLVTLGSGLGKLEELLRLKGRVGTMRTVGRLAPAFLLLAVLATRVVFFERWDSLSLLSVMALGGTIFLSSIVAVVKAQQHWIDVERWMPELSLKAQRPELEWIDVYATRDPVSNGPLSPLETPIASKQTSIRNLESFVGDHTSYWQNRAQFVSTVARAVADAAKIPLLDDTEAARLDDVALVHERNVRWLSATSWGAFAAIVVLPLLHWKSLQTPGAAVETALRALGGPFEKVLSVLHRIVIAFVSARGAFDADSVQRSVLGALIFAALILLWRRGYRPAIWQRWDDSSLERALHPDRVLHPVDRFAVDALVIAAGFAPLLLVLGWSRLEHLLVGHVVAGMMLVLIVLMFVALAAGLVATVVKRWPEIRRGDRGLRKEVSDQAAAFGAMVLTLGMIVPAFVDALKPLRELITTSLVAVFYIGVIAAAQRATRKRVSALTDRRAARVAAQTVTVALTALVAARIVANYLSGTAPAGPNDNAGSLVILLLTTYLASLGLVWAVLWLVGRLRKRPTLA